MGNFQNNAITDVGRMLLADVQAGAVFTPTRIVIGSGTMPSGATTQGMTDVITPVKSLQINKKKRTPDGKCIFGGVYTNEEVTVPFYFRELALYAKAVYLNEDGSVKFEGAEVLYSYGNAGATADYMAAYSTSTVVEKQMDLVTWVGNNAQVDLTIESGIYAPAGYGLGANATPLSITEITDLDPVHLNGWYSFVLPSTTQVNGVNFQYGYMRVDNFDSYSCTQTIYVVDVQGTILRRKKINNAWGEFECENPPFAVDVEYRTTERRNGVAVYKKIDADGVLRYRLEGETAWRTYAEENSAVNKTGDTMTGDLSIEKAIAAVKLKTENGTANFFKNANATTDLGTTISDVTATGVTDRLILSAFRSHVDKLRLVTSDGLTHYVLHTGNKDLIMPADIGAASAKLVHKVYDANSNEALDAIIEVELADMPRDSIRHICVSDIVGGTVFYGGLTHITINKTTEEYANIEAIKYHTFGVFKWRRCKYINWQGWEWENPPLDRGVEYRTTERYLGSVVYKKVNSNGDVLWRIEGETSWRLQSSASYVSAATVE